MAHITTDDGVRLFVEEVGSGAPLVFAHEFAGDYRSWAPQVRYFSRLYRVVTYNARGWPPSDVPDRSDAYSQRRAADDIRAVLDGLGIEKAHVAGLSMGGFATLHFGLNYPERARSLLVAGVGYGAERQERAKFEGEADFIAAELREKGMAPFAAKYALGPTRVQFQNKDPLGWREFADMLAEHSAEGAAFNQLGIQKVRPSIYDLEEGLRQMKVPMMIVTGDEDWPCLNPNLFMKRVTPSAGLAMLPNTGHTLNLEEPALFNAVLERFLAQVDAGRWPQRDPRAVSDSITGMK